jgi:hypothetical protein
MKRFNCSSVCIYEKFYLNFIFIKYYLIITNITIIFNLIRERSRIIITPTSIGSYTPRIVNLKQIKQCEFQDMYCLTNKYGGDYI